MDDTLANIDLTVLRLTLDEALKIEELSVEDAMNSMIPDQTPEMNQLIEEEVPILIELAKENANFEFPVNERLNCLIQDFLKQPSIKKELINAHPHFIALLKHPHMDPNFCSRIFDEGYLNKHFDRKEFENNKDLLALNPGPTEPKPKNKKYSLETIEFVSYTETKKSTKDIVDQYDTAPLSIQLMTEAIPANTRIMKFFFPDSLPDNLRAKSILKDFTIDELKLFFKTTGKYFRWVKNAVKNYVYLSCEKGKKYYETKSKTKKTGCPATIRLQIKDGKIKMVYEFHHNHSFIDHQEVVSATIRDAVRNWLIQQALQGRDWAWVNSQRSKVNFGTNIASLDHSLKFNCQLYHRIRQKLGIFTGRVSSKLEESLKEYQDILSQNGYVKFWLNLNENNDNSKPRTWGFAFATDYMLTKLQQYGNTIFIDSTSNIGKSDKITERVFLYTVMVLDTRIGQPVSIAWLLTHTQGSCPLYLLLHDLNTRHGLNPSLICIDCANIERKAIRAAFPNEKDHEVSYCFYHLHKALKGIINSYITLSRGKIDFDGLLQKGILTRDMIERKRHLQTMGDGKDYSSVSDFINSIIDITTGDIKVNPIKNLINNPDDQSPVERNVHDLAAIEEFLASDNLQNEKIRIGEPKPFPQTQDDIVDVKRLATTGFYQIISLKNEEEANQKIQEYTTAFIEYPYYIIYMHYWLKQKECWLKGCSVNQSGIDFTSNLVASWHSILNEKVLNKSRMARADIIIYTLFYEVLPYYENKDGVSDGNTNKPNLIQASKRNKDTVDALTMEDLEKRVEIKRSKILVQSSRQEDIFYEIKKDDGNKYSCNCESYRPIKLCTHVYIVARFLSVHPPKRTSNKRKAATTETINKLQKIAPAKNNETHEYQGQSVQPEYHASLTEDHSFPLTPLTYNYDSNSTDSQFNSFNQPTTEIDFPDINEPDGHIPLITKEEINKDIAEAIKVLKDTSKYVRENGSYEELLKFSNHTRDFTLNVKKLLLNNP